MNQKQLLRSLRFLQIENIATGLIVSMPIMTLFFNKEIGMNMAQIGLSQAFFTIAVIAINIPTGWLADRFSHKWANFLGDLTLTVGFLLYAFADSFAQVVLCEIIVGIGLALTTGADTALMRYYCQKLGKNYAKVTAHLAVLRPLGIAAGMVLGGLIGAYSLRLALAANVVGVALGAILSLFLVDTTVRRKSQHHPVRDIAIIVKYCAKHRPLAWRIAAYAAGRESTHAIVWLFTPLLVAAQMPMWLVGISWSIHLAASSLGAMLAKKFTKHNLQDWQKFATTAGLALAGTAILAIAINPFTIAFYGLLSLAYGWASAVGAPIVQAHTPEDIQGTVMSVADNASRLLYIPLVWIICALADISLQTALIGSLLIFAPLCAVITAKLFKLGRLPTPA